MPVPATASHAAGEPPGVEAAGSAKAAVRSAVLRARRERLRTAPHAVAADGAAVADVVLGTPEISGLAAGATVAAYLELPTEVPTGVLRAALHARGIRVLVPVLRADHDLDWVRWLPPGAAAGDGPPQSADIRDAAAMLLPGVAGDRGGNRLGRGGGSYDRVLGRIAARVAGPSGTDRCWTCLLLFTDELLPAVPVEPHDAVVDAVATPAGLHRTDRSRAH